MNQPLILLLLFLEYSPDSNDVTIGSIVRNLDTGTWVTCMDNTVVSHVDCNVTAVADDVAGFSISDSAGYSSSYGAKCVGGMRKRSSEMSVDGHYKTGAVGAMCKTGAAIYVWVSKETSCVSYNRFPFGAVGGSSTVCCFDIFAFYISDHIPNLYFNPGGVCGKYFYFRSFFQSELGTGIAILGRVDV